MITVFGAVEDVNLTDKVQEFFEEEGSRPSHELIFEFPETQFCGVHVNKMIKHIRRIVADAIKDSQDMAIITAHELVLMAVRAEIAVHKADVGRVVTFGNDGDYKIATIQACGSLTYWHLGVFDTWDNLIDEMFL